MTQLSKEEMRKMRENMQVIFQDPFASLNPRMRIGKSIGHPLASSGVRLFNQLAEAHRPRDLASLDAYLRPCVEAFVQFPAPLASDTPITATK